ncbi:hypothetical protein EUX98_g8200 [Antrodiella citrinella]|uniref:C2 domain-containing protein n=1 Tax=Antrodiella citrinella TaxID=2447956 RepID=A0A4S4MB12_9APHY|nr:hypothetical protein EUX98_g8200 [Antrodiella citrinella]
MPFEPSYLTIVRTQGIQFLRADKACRPVVTVNIINAGHTDASYESLLGSDGQNPNLKSPFVLREIDLGMYLDITVSHKSSGKRKRRHLVGSAYVTVGELLKRQSRVGADVELKLSCPPPQKRSPTIGGNRQLGSASVTVRLRSSLPASSISSSSVTAVDSPATSVHTDDEDASDSEAGDYFPIMKDASKRPTTLRRRKKPRVKGYCINTSDEEVLSSLESLSSCLPSPTDVPPYQSFDIEWDKDECADVEPTIVLAPSESWLAPRVLPRYIDQVSLAGGMNVAERVLDWVGPYKEMRDAEEEEAVEKIMGRLLTEWYVVGGSLLAVAAVFAAAFGFATSDTVFPVDGLARRAIALGSIAAGLGIAVDAWLLVVYSGLSPRKFQSRALDVYATYAFFTLTSRLPLLSLAFAALALMLFLLTVAWDAWPTAVLVMSCAAGVLVSLQWLVFGAHRVGNGVVWVGRRVVSGRAAAVNVNVIVNAPRGRAQQSEAEVDLDVKRRRGGDVHMPVPDTNATGIIGEASTSTHASTSASSVTLAASSS